MDISKNQHWCYHGVANVIRAHSLIRSFPEVDDDRTAITGISWGGFLTCIVSGLDDRFKAAIRSTKEVMIGYYVTGDADFILVITAKDMEDYEAFTRRFFYENHDIKGFKTMVVMDRVKAGFSFPIET